MEKQQWVMVMLKGPNEKEFGLEKAFSITTLGAKEAMERAQSFMEQSADLYRNCEYKLQGGEW